MKVLFLGGPRHSERREVMPLSGYRYDRDALPETVNFTLLEPAEYIPGEMPSIQTESMTVVRYGLKWVNQWGNGSSRHYRAQLPVYVSTGGYDGRPRACDPWDCDNCLRGNHVDCRSLTCPCEHVKLSTVAAMLADRTISTHPLNEARYQLAGMIKDGVVIPGSAPPATIEASFLPITVMPGRTDGTLVIFCQCKCQCPPTLHDEGGCRNEDCGCIRSKEALWAVVDL